MRRLDQMVGSRPAPARPALCSPFHSHALAPMFSTVRNLLSSSVRHDSSSRRLDALYAPLKAPQHTLNHPTAASAAPTRHIPATPPKPLLLSAALSPHSTICSSSTPPPLISSVVSPSCSPLSQPLVSMQLVEAGGRERAHLDAAEAHLALPPEARKERRCFSWHEGC